MKITWRNGFFVLLFVGVILSSKSFAGVRVSNLGLAGEHFSLAVGETFVLIRVKESSQNMDLNGDGDTFDRVLHIYNTVTEDLVNTGYEIFYVVADGNKGAFSIRENGEDLNGDNDTNDYVVHVIDGISGEINNTGTAGSNLMLAGSLLAFTQYESQSNQDLNGDGDKSDSVLQVYNFFTGITTNLGFAISSSATRLDDKTVAFGVFERSHGYQDLNGDGDTDDAVIYVYNATTGETTSTGKDAGYSLTMDQGWVAFLRYEGRTGNTDLNGDGDRDDSVVQLYSPVTKQTRNLAIAAYQTVLENGRLHFIAVESGQQEDLNNDGDLNDSVLMVMDLNSGATLMPGLESRNIRVQGDKVVALVSEYGSGDLNGDGDNRDQVLHIYDFNTTVTTNLGLAAGYSYILDGDFLAFTVNESQQGRNGTDLNGDGKIGGGILHVYDLDLGVTINAGMDVIRRKAVVGMGGARFQLKGDHVLFSSEEAASGPTDFNGDRDEIDSVLHIFDAAAGRLTNLGLAVWGDAVVQDFELGRNLAVFVVDEKNQDNEDLNGDGDTADHVVHVGRIESSSPELSVLIRDIEALEISGTLHQQESRPLLKDLERSRKHLKKENYKHAEFELRKFVHGVEKLIKRNTLTRAQGQPLINTASGIQF